MFQPHSCLGFKPTICHSGPLYDQTQFQCARGILTGENKLRSNCPITLSEDPQQSELITEVSPGTFVISSEGGAFSLLCSGKSEKRLPLTPGAHLLSLRSDCRLRGHGWEISGTMTRHSDVIIRPPRINVLPLNLTEWVPDEVILSQLEGPTWKALKRIEDVRLSSLMYPDDNLSWITTVQPAHWLGMSTLFVLLCICVFIVFVLWKHRLLAFCKEQATDPEPESAPLRDDGLVRDVEQASQAMPPAWKEIILQTQSQADTNS